MATAVSPSHPTQLESYGTHCHFAPCGLADFLPFQCPHCHHSYCSSHRTPDSHSCEQYTAIDRRAVPCPICGQVLKIDEYMRRHGRSISSVEQVDINAVMEDHLSSGSCAKINTTNGLLADNGSSSNNSEAAANRAPKKTERQCKYARCTNQCWIDLRCDKCGKGFCPTHRDPKHHKCGPAGFGSTGATSSGSQRSSRSASPLPPRRQQQHDSTGSSATPSSKLFNKLSLTDKKKLSASASASTSASPSVSLKAKTPVTSTPPLTKTDSKDPTPSGLSKLKHHLPSTNGASEERMASKRAAKERESAALALKKRAEKGLLSEEEKIRYATLQAMQAKSGNTSKNNKDCCIS